MSLKTYVTSVATLAALILVAPLQVRAAEKEALARGTFRFVEPAVKFDVSPPLRSMRVIPPPDEINYFAGSLMADPDPVKKGFGPQSTDRSVQSFLGPVVVPAPIANFNVGTGTANPPDPVGDIGPNHYVRMANASFQIFNRTGTNLFGPANINTLFTGFGGACETENAGDPIVLYDQLADRWLLTQFSDGSGPGFFNCVALSTTSDPTGTYFRWAFPTAVFPDYPKYGVWPNAYVFTTRELGTPSNIGAYAVDRTQMLAGVANPTIISFLVELTEEQARFVGDGLLPADLDGDTLPPTANPTFLIGAMDDGGPYGATEDALAVWEFNIDFATPANSSLLLTDVLPIAPYDTIYPCNGRSCIPQPAPLGAVDILSYRQRPINRAAYRNFGSYQSIVTNQSVEAATALGGTRWWEIRNPGNNPAIYQDSTFAPGVTDGVHRWMASIAQDSAGNLGMGYSAGSAALFPSIRYTGRLESDPLNTMRGEGIFVNGGGGHTAATRRWGDYTSINIDPTDDCTFWYINQYFAVSGTQWTLRAGSFKFPECGTPSFGVAAVPLQQAVCAPDSAQFTVETHAYDGFTGGATLAATGVPAGYTSSFSPANIASVPGNSTLTLSSTGASTAGLYEINVSATSGAVRQRSVNLDLQTAVPTAPALVSPAPGAVNQSLSPLLSWGSATQGRTYVVEVATDSGFNTIVFTSPAITATSFQVPALAFNTNYFWRVRSTNICGPGTVSATGTFTTRPTAGQCGAGTTLRTEFTDNIENGVNGWTTDPVAGTTWTRSQARPNSGSFAWLAVDVVTASDQRLISPAITIPASRSLSTLRFDHDVSMEENGATACFDGGFVEISTNNGSTWTPLDRPSQLEDFYDGGLSSGQQAWCGIQPYTTASLDISAFAGQTVRFRFRAITDTSVGSVPHGWYVDDVRVIGCDQPDLLVDGFEGP